MYRDELMDIVLQLKQLLLKKSFGQISSEEYVLQKAPLLQKYLELEEARHALGSYNFVTRT